jgi:hypothetical protein
VQLLTDPERQFAQFIGSRSMPQSARLISSRFALLSASRAFHAAPLANSPGATFCAVLITPCKFFSADKMISAGLAAEIPPSRSFAMAAKYIRVLRKKKDVEVLININSISKIEVKYAVEREKEGETAFYGVSLKEGMANPQAVRVYTIISGGERFALPANPGSKVMKVLEDIYKNAIRDD